jgi:hypothetical protein
VWLAWSLPSWGCRCRHEEQADRDVPAGADRLC